METHTSSLKKGKIEHVQFHVSLYDSKTDTQPKRVELTWRELGEKLSHFREGPCTPQTCAGKGCPYKDGPSWSPALLDGTRKEENVFALTLAVFDLDHVTVDQLDGMRKRLEGVASYTHSSHNHSPEDQALRLVIPLKEPFRRLEGESVKDYKARWIAARRAIIDKYGIPADPACKDLSRLYFLPSCRKGAPRVFESRAGQALDLCALIASSPPTEPVQAPVRFAPTPQRPSFPPASKEELEAALTQALRFPPSISDQGGNNAAFAVACFLVNDWGLSAEEALALLHLWNKERAFPPWSAEDLARFIRNARNYAQGSYGSARLDYRAGQALRSFARDHTRGRAEQSPRVADFGVLDLLQKGEKGPFSNRHNYAVILQNDPRWKGKLAFDEFRKEIVFLDSPPWLESHAPPVFPQRGEAWQEEDTARLCAWLEACYRLRPRTDHVESALRLTAKKASYNSVKAFYQGVRWDGRQRLEGFFPKYLGTEDTLYEREIGRCFWLSVIARVEKPGCFLKYVPILEGPQDLGKSRLLMSLAPDERFFLEGLQDIATKEAAIQLRGKLIVELGELAALRKADSESMKAFISRPSDSYRAPYDRQAKDHPRTCVLVGTTNASSYLKDETGNVRYWPIRCTRALPVESDELAQLYAEAYARYQAGEKYWPTSEAFKVLAREEQEDRYQADVWEEKVLTALEALQLDAKTSSEGVTLGEVHWKAFIAYTPPPSALQAGLVRAPVYSGEGVQELGRSEQMRLAGILTRAGWESRRVRLSGLRAIRWFPPKR